MSPRRPQGRHTTAVDDFFPRAEGTKATHTALSFRVDDIAAAVRALEQHIG
ncbi:MAG: hypothetical protein ACXWUL_09575 [Caldimonas sp.]